MSQSPSRAWLRRVAGTLACAPTLVALGACHHRSSAVSEPAPAERTVRRDQQSNDERLPRFPGVDVIRTRSGGFSIRIVSGLVGGGDPIYIIDGMETVVEPRRGIDWLAPEDIVRINALKDPAQTAVYGPRGVNGVILITTKRAAMARRREP